MEEYESLHGRLTKGRRLVGRLLAHEGIRIKYK